MKAPVRATLVGTLLLASALFLFSLAVWGIRETTRATASPADELHAVGPAGAQPIGPAFTVNFDVNTDSANFQGYSVYVEYDAAVVQADSWTQLQPAGLSICAPTLIDNVGPPGHAEDNGCAAESPVGPFAGTVSTLTMHCIATGTSPLDLRSIVEVGAFGSSLFSSGGGTIDTTVTDAQVVCGEGGAAPSPTSGPEVPTPTPTQVGPMATPTPLPPGWEAIHLFGGCQFEAWTGANGTGAGELAGLVGPAGNLRSLWAQQPPPSWRGYSPQFPAASDMGPVDQLDVLAICTTGAGDFVRPVL